MSRRHITTRPALAFAAVGLALALGVADTIETRAGAGCHIDDGAGYSEGTTAVVRMDVCSFEPTVVRVPVGANVRFINTASNDHAVSGRRNSWGSTDTMAPGAEFSERFREAGVYPFTCPLHPGMVGTVIVGDGGAADAPVTSVDAPVTSVDADAARASVAPAATDQIGSPALVAAALGAAGGGLTGLVVGLVVARRRPTVTVSDAVRATPALDR